MMAYRLWNWDQGMGLFSTWCRFSEGLLLVIVILEFCMLQFIHIHPPFIILSHTHIYIQMDNYLKGEPGEMGGGKASERGLMGEMEHSNGNINEEREEGMGEDREEEGRGYGLLREEYERRLVQAENSNKEWRVRAGQLSRLCDKSYIHRVVQQKKHILLLNRIDSILPILSPQSSALLAWNMLMMVVIIFEVLEIPIAMFLTSAVYEFQTNTGVGLAINIICLLLLYFDMLVVRICISYYHKGKLVSGRMSIVTAYLQPEFILNLIAILSLTIYISSGRYYLVYLKILFVLKLYSLAHIDSQILHVLEFRPLPYALYRLAKLLVLLWFLCSLAGSIYFAIDYSYYMEKGQYYQDGKLWLTNSLAVGNLDILHNNGWFIWYSYALYWAIQTASTVGYGDITPMNPPQVIFVILVILFMTILFAFYVNTIWKILQDLYSNRIEYSEMWQKYKNYMRGRKDLPSTLKYQISNCLYELWEDKVNQQIEEEVINKKINAELRDSFYVEYKQVFFRGIHLFKGLDCEAVGIADVMGDFVAIIQNYNLSEGNQVYAEGQFDEYLYYLRKGEVELTIGGSVLRERVEQGHNFGVEGFFRRRARSHTATTHAFTKMWRASYSKLQSVLHKHPYLNQQYSQFEYWIVVEKSPMFLNLQCWKCKSKFHFMDECPLVNSWRDKMAGYSNRVTSYNLQSYLVLMAAGIKNERRAYVRSKVQSRRIKNEDHFGSRKRSMGKVEGVEHFRYYFPDFNISP